jgi:protein-disulfide isomerase
VLRELATGEPTLAAAGFITARCAGPARYFQVVDEIFKRQASMFEPGAHPSDILQDIAGHAGLTPARYNACLGDHRALDALNARVARHADVDKVDSTPTFIVGGTTFVGEQTLDQLDAAIAAARPRRR